MLVVDASVAVKWFLDEPGDREARALVERSEALIAPELIVAEVLNAISKRLLAGDADIRQGPRVAAVLPKVLAQIRSLGPLAARTLEIAAELRHPAYDCFYLALAEERQAKLVTADRRLLGRLAGTPWQDDAISLWN
jgi:predicted nucleic acid-binding protein